MARQIYQPSRRLLIFGDGTMASIHLQKSGVIDNTGTLVTEFMIIPTADMKDFYDLKNDDYTREGWIPVQVPQHLLVNLNDDPVVNTTMALCDFEGNATILSQKFPDKQKMAELQQHILILKRTASQLRQELRIAVSHNKEYARQFVEISHTFRKANADVIQDQEEQEIGEAR